MPLDWMGPVRGRAKKGAPTRSRRKRGDRKRRYSTLQLRRHARQQRMLRNAHVRSAELYTGRSNIEVVEWGKGRKQKKRLRGNRGSR